METTSFSLIGSIWIFIGFSILLISFTIYSYFHTLPPISRNSKALLISLRSLAMIILLFILFEPAFIRTKAKILSPKLAVLIDNSISNGMKDRSQNRKEIVDNLLNGIDFKQFKQDVVFYKFANKTYKIDNFAADSINFSGQITDISQALERIRNSNKDDNIQAILIISDGAINSGRNPLYSPENFEKPIFTIGVGDTLAPKDVSVKSIISAEVGFVNTPLEIFVNIKSTGYSNPEKITFFEDDKQIDTKTINLTKEQTDYSQSFIYTPTTEGIHKLSFKIDNLPDEFSYENNYSSVYIKIIKNKKNIAIFSSAPTPDVSFINQYLSQDKEAKINLFIQKKGSEFYTQPTAKDLSDAQLFILVDFPNKQTPDNVLSLLFQELSKGKPLLFLAGADLDYKRLNKISSFLPFDVVSSSDREFNTYIQPINISDNPILRVDGVNNSEKLWENLPSIYKTETFINAKIESKVLANMKIENVKLSEPILIMRELQGNKSLALLASGIYKWKLAGYGGEISKGNTDQIDLFNVFMNNAMRWLSISSIEKQFSVKTSKKNYTTSEEIEFIANVFDNSFNPIDNAQIEVTIKGQNFVQNLQIPSLGNGNYSLKIPSLPKGDYSYFANAIVDGNQFAKDEGRFSVGSINFEYLDLTMNKNLLSALSENSGGKFYMPKNAKSVVQDIKNLSNFKDRMKLQKSEFQIWNKLWLLALSIILFAAEWSIRKRLSML